MSIIVFIDLAVAVACGCTKHVYSTICRMLRRVAKDELAGCLDSW